jgi:dTDP-4-amino-4,6-dideoxygalactose transaminase
MFPEAEAYGETAITIPLYVGLSDDDQGRVVQAIHEVLDA